VGDSDLALVTRGLLDGDRVPPFPASPSLSAFLDGALDAPPLPPGWRDGDREVGATGLSVGIEAFLDGALDAPPLPPDGCCDGEREVVAAGLSVGIKVDSTVAGGLTGSGGRTVAGVDVLTIAAGDLTGSAGRTVAGVEVESNETGGLTGSAGRAVAGNAARGTGASDTGLGVDRTRGETMNVYSELS
jgi:hypothetical protein